MLLKSLDEVRDQIEDEQFQPTQWLTHQDATVIDELHTKPIFPLDIDD